MAFWRWSTMDSWNPFSSRFWRLANLFGQSDFEYIQQLKVNIYQTLYNAILNNHPTQKMGNIVCPLTKKSIQTPVIIREGIIYEKTVLLRRMALSSRLPSINHNLHSSQVYDFPELKGLLKFAQKRLEQFETNQAEILNSARKVISKSDYGTEYAKVFTCPLSHQLIHTPLISPKGRVYDKEAIIGYLEKTQANQDPIDGSPLRADALLPFDEFSLLLALYRNRVAETKQQAFDYTKSKASVLKTGLEFVGGFFQPNEGVGGDNSLFNHSPALLYR